MEELHSRFVAAVQRQLLSDVPIALMASGGVDSSLIWWAAGECVERAYTIEWIGRHWRRTAIGGHGDRAGAQRTARYASDVRRRGGSLRQPCPAQATCSPTPRTISLAPSRARHQTDGFKVLLSGQGGDELFAGYARHRIAPFLRQLRLGAVGKVAEQAISHRGRGLRAEYMARIARAASERDPFASYMQLCTYSAALDRARVLGCSEAEVSNEAVWQRHRAVFDALPAGASFLRKAMALDLAVYLPGLGLAYNDRASMEHGVEVRVPWLDLELVRWSLTLPDSVLIRRRRAKWLPKELAARVRLAAGGPASQARLCCSSPIMWRPDGRLAAVVSGRDDTLRWPHPSSSSMARYEPIATCPSLTAHD